MLWVWVTLLLAMLDVTLCSCSYTAQGMVPYEASWIIMHYRAHVKGTCRYLHREQIQELGILPLPDKIRREVVHDHNIKCSKTLPVAHLRVCYGERSDDRFHDNSALKDEGIQVYSVGEYTLMPIGDYL